MKKRVTFTLEEELIERLKKVSSESLIPQAKLIEKSLQQVLDEHENK